eukprot:33506_1
MDESDSSSQPPPGRPGETDDYFVPFYQMTPDNSEKRLIKARPKIHDEQKTNSTIILETYDEETNNNNKSKDKSETLPVRSMKRQSQTSNHSDSIPTPVPSNNNNSTIDKKKVNNNNNLKNSASNSTVTTNSSISTTKSSNSVSVSTSPPSNINNNNQHLIVQQSSIAKPDFSRATKWDIVYLTSSPLVFGSDPYKPLDQLDISGERDGFFNTLKASKQALRVIHKTATTSNIIAAVTGGCRCIHYSGHGYPSYLAFEDAKRIG